MGAGRKRKAAPWDGQKGWKHVTVGDDLMLGSTESGFMGLEVLEPEDAPLFGNHKTQRWSADNGESDDFTEAQLDDAQATDKEGQRSSNKAKAADTPSKKAKHGGEAAKPPSESSKLAALEAKIATLEAENSALKAHGSGEAVKPVKEKKAAKSAAKTTVTTAPEGQQPAAKEEQVDISAWSQFELHAKIAAAIAEAGFTQPTPIQEQCLLPAIRDRRDVIGAAQTVSSAMHAQKQPRCSCTLDNAAACVQPLRIVIAAQCTPCA